MTSLTDTDTYGVLFKADALTGGMALIGYSDSIIGVFIQGIVTTAQTEAPKTTSSSGAVILSGALKSGTTKGDMSANGNLLVVRNRATTKFILDADGDSHQDVGTAWTNFDTYNDMELLDTIAFSLREGFGTFLDENKTLLEKLKIVSYEEVGHPFINWSRWGMLMTGAVRQLSSRVEELETELNNILLSGKT